MSKLNDRPLRAISTEEDLANMIRNRDAFVRGMGEEIYQDSIEKLKAHIRTKRKKKMKAILKRSALVVCLILIIVLVAIPAIPLQIASFIADATVLLGRTISSIGFQLGTYVVNSQAAIGKVVYPTIDKIKAWSQS